MLETPHFGGVDSMVAGSPLKTTVFFNNFGPLGARSALTFLSVSIFRASGGGGSDANRCLCNVFWAFRGQESNQNQCFSILLGLWGPRTE